MYPQAWQVHEELSDGCRQISEVVALNSPKGNNNENMYTTNIIFVFPEMQQKYSIFFLNRSIIFSIKPCKGFDSASFHYILICLSCISWHFDDKLNVRYISDIWKYSTNISCYCFDGYNQFAHFYEFYISFSFCIFYPANGVYICINISFTSMVTVKYYWYKNYSTTIFLV